MELILDDSLLHFEIIHPEGTIPVIILHGWGHSGHMWRPVAQALPADFKVYLVDLPGFGHSSLGESVNGIQDYVHIILAFIQKLNLKHVCLIGHSFGAHISVMVATQNKVISKLILIAPALKRQRRRIGVFLYTLLAVVAKLKHLLPQSWTYHLSSGLNYVQATPRLKTVFKNSIHEDVLKLLPKITVNTLVVWGEKDREILGKPKEIVGLIPHSRLKVIYDAGHNLHVEKPIELIRIMERWLC